LSLTWPYDVFDVVERLRGADEDGARIAELAPLSLHPPFPWGQRAYGRLLRARGRQLRGDLIECGVGMGGMSLFLAQHAVERGCRHYALDSFTGLPAPDATMDNAYFREGDYGSRAERGDLLDRFRREVEVRGLDHVVEVVPGFLDQTLGRLPADAEYALIHLDLDLYQPVFAALEALYPRLREGGILIIDDFFHPARGPARAVEAYFAGRGATPYLHVSFPYSVVIIKGEAPPAEGRRAVDGNRYSFQLLREDALLRRVVAESAARSEAEGDARSASEARLLLDVLDRPEELPSDIYDYWRALAQYWHSIGADRPAERAPVTI
jgi:O-methyltransferase